MFERFTDQARKAMAYANQQAQRLNNEHIGTEHILLGLLKEGEITEFLKKNGYSSANIQKELEKFTKTGPDMITMGKLPQTPIAKKAIEMAVDYAKERGTDMIGTEHLFYGLVKETEGIASQVLTNIGLTTKIFDEMKQPKDIYDFLKENGYEIPKRKR